MPLPATPTSIGSLLMHSGSTSYVLFALYLVTLVFSVRRFCALFWRTELARSWDTPDIFLASIVFLLLVRSLSFLTLAVLAFANVQISDGSGGGSGSQADYPQLPATVLAVLFNVGDWATISTYLLLVVLWVEFLATVRRHWYSPTSIRRDWLIAYLVLVSLIYMVQLGLYVAVFTSRPEATATLFSAIYAVIAFLNLGIPLLLLFSWLVYAIMYSGFPYRSASRKRSWLRLSRLVALWTAGRVMWAAAAVLLANDWATTALASLGDAGFTVVTVTLFLLAELLPAVASLGSEVLALFGWAPTSSDDAGDSAAGTGGSAAQMSAGTTESDGEDFKLRRVMSGMSDALLSPSDGSGAVSSAGDDDHRHSSSSQLGNGGAGAGMRGAAGVAALENGHHPSSSSGSSSIGRERGDGRRAVHFQSSPVASGDPSSRLGVSSGGSANHVHDRASSHNRNGGGGGSSSSSSSNSSNTGGTTHAAPVLVLSPPLGPSAADTLTPSSASPPTADGGNPDGSGSGARGWGVTGVVISSISTLWNGGWGLWSTGDDARSSPTAASSPAIALHRHGTPLSRGSVASLLSIDSEGGRSPSVSGGGGDLMPRNHSFVSALDESEYPVPGEPFR